MIGGSREESDHEVSGLRELGKENAQARGLQLKTGAASTHYT